jgi:hypothetical protein
MIVTGKRGRLSILAVTAVAATAFALGHASASTRGHVYTGRPGDTFRVPAAETRCSVSTEAGAGDVLCGHVANGRYSVVFFKDGLFVYRNGKPDNPVFHTDKP